MIGKLKSVEKKFRSDSTTVALRYMTARVMIYCPFLV